MRFSPGSAFWGLAATAALFGRTQAQIGDCSGGPFKSHAVGYDTGGEWCATKWKQGGAINGIQAWYNGDSINGVEFQYSNGAAPEMYGQQYGDKKEWLTWDTTKEEVEHITVWPNGYSDVRRVAAIEIKIAGREAWKAGSEPKNTQGYDSPVVNGAGIIMGAYGRQGGSIDMIAFNMLESGISNRKMDKFNLDGTSLASENEKIKNASPESVDSFTQENWTGENITYSVEREHSKTREWSTTRSSSSTFGGSVGASLDFGLPVIGLGGSVTTEFHWEQTNSIETTDSGSESVGLTFSVSGMIPKGEAIYCESLAFTGKYDLEYTSTIVLELQSGATWEYEENGVTKGVSWSRSENKCVSYQEGEDGPTVLAKKLEEWKNKPEEEEKERIEREQRAEESLKKLQSTSTSEATPSATGEAEPTETPKEDESTGDEDESTGDEDESTGDEDESTGDEDESTGDEDESTGDEDESTEDESTADEPTEDESTEDESTEDESTADEPTEDDSTEDESAEDESTEDESTEDEPTEDESTADEPTEQETTEETSAEETTSAVATPAVFPTIPLIVPNETAATEEPVPTTSSEAPKATSKATSSSRPRATPTKTKKKGTRAEITPAPEVVYGKRSLTFTA